MNLSHQHLQLLYQAYCKTHFLWMNDRVFKLKQCHLPVASNPQFLRKLDKQLRLGQLAEQFVFNQIETSDTAELLAENIQIQKDKQTLGELDALIRVSHSPIHLEIVYKFYVYDDTLGSSELEQWIGPNRKDSLIEKLNKLKEKQLPLLYSNACKANLEKFGVNTISVEQQVLFKAQLFVPYQQEVSFNLLDERCVCGFFITNTQLKDFRDSQFYIPMKLDWFLEPHHKVDWLSFNDFRSDVNAFLEQQQSPLFWMKNERQELSKCFLVWWQN
ncbi:DUF1853 family protein [uncultured Psychroserpens sp.]|uniref:DUF1853 family protein n=1 Tax=uncultured Psychroserpens sp. TaxID=255436 RepID=UPI002610E354|nr:DUF1853 family protein [uncultured Psychroserpens sp.]